MSLKQKVFKEAINTVVASKNLRRMAVNQLDRGCIKPKVTRKMITSRQARPNQVKKDYKEK